MKFINEYCTFDDTTKTLTFNRGIRVLGRHMVPEDAKDITEKIIIPNGVTTINAEVFRNYRKLIEVDISDSVQVIGEYAFSNCDSLKNIHIGTNIHTVCGGCFNFCNALEKVFIKDLSNWCRIDFLSHYSNPLYNDADLYIDGKIVKNLVIPNDVKSISRDAFASCQSVETVLIPSNVEHIHEYAFWNCTNIKSVKIENGLTGIGDSAFYNCSSLNNFNLPSSLCFIGKDALATHSDKLIIDCAATKFLKQWAKENDFDIITSEINKFLNNIDDSKNIGY